MSVTLKEIPAKVAAFAEFDANSTKARMLVRTDFIGSGRLPAAYRQMFESDRAKAHAKGHPVYVVLSYETPIAWCEIGTDTKTVVVPDVRYSVTTTKNLGKVREGFARRSDTEFVCE